MYQTFLFAGAATLIILWLTLKFLAKRKVQNLHTKYVFISGCDSGFGRETAIRLDKMGVHVLAACLTKQGAQDLKSTTSGKLKTFQMDVTDSQQIKDVFRQVNNLLPSGQGVWGLVNNAGVFTVAPIEWTPLEHMKHIADVNLWGMIDVTKTFLPLIKKSHGRVVNLSSMAGLMSFPHASAYCISKYGVEAFSDALRREMSPWGVLVSMVEPGKFQTGIAHNVVETIKQLWNNLSLEMKEDYEDKRLDGSLWGLVNNAGIGLGGPVEWIPLEHMKHIADVNLWGMIDVTKTFLPLIKMSQGRVVNLSSMAGRTTLSLFSAYGISKYGVEAFSDALRREMSPWGVLVSVIEPGKFQTGITYQIADSVKQLWNNLSPEMKDDYEDKHLDGISMAKGMQLLVEKGSSPDTYKVVDAIVDGLTSQRPQTRYVVGLDAKLLVSMSYLPTFFSDYVLRVN